MIDDLDIMTALDELHEKRRAKGREDLDALRARLTDPDKPHHPGCQCQNCRELRRSCFDCHLWRELAELMGESGDLADEIERKERRDGSR